jgi:hypothetical protein
VGRLLTRPSPLPAAPLPAFKQPGYEGRKLVGSLGAENRFFDFEKLAEVTRVVTENLNKVGDLWRVAAGGVVCCMLQCRVGQLPPRPERLLRRASSCFAPLSPPPPPRPQIIDINYYPVEAARNSNMRHRPIGIGVQGLADAFLLLGLPFDSAEAKQLNKEIFETIYYAALQVRRGRRWAWEGGSAASSAPGRVPWRRGRGSGCARRPRPPRPQPHHRAGAHTPNLSSTTPPPHPTPPHPTPTPPSTPPHPIPHPAAQTSNALAKLHGPYASYEGSPVSQGRLQHDLWGVPAPSKRWDWDGLRASIKEHGVRNSLLLAPMPTASTSQILGNNECFEPYTSNIYVRRVLSGERLWGPGTGALRGDAGVLRRLRRARAQQEPCPHTPRAPSHPLTAFPPPRPPPLPPGEFTVVNQHLLHDLTAKGMWNPALKNELVAANGSVQVRARGRGWGGILRALASGRAPQRPAAHRLPPSKRRLLPSPHPPHPHPALPLAPPPRSWTSPCPSSRCTRRCGRSSSATSSTWPPTAARSSTSRSRSTST